MKDTEDSAYDHVVCDRLWVETPVCCALSAKRVAIVLHDLVGDEFALLTAIDDHHASADVLDAGFLNNDQGVVAEKVAHGVALGAVHAPVRAVGGDHFRVAECFFKRSGGLGAGKRSQNGGEDCYGDQGGCFHAHIIAFYVFLRYRV